MPDTIERTIYKLEIDESGYLRGIDSLSYSTTKFTENLYKANRAVEINETALQTSVDALKEAKKALDEYSGADQKYRQRLQENIASEEQQVKRFTDTLVKNKVAFENAKKAGQDFADISLKATNLQQQTTGGKIPIPNALPQTFAAKLSNQIGDTLNFSALSAQEEIIKNTAQDFKYLEVSIDFAEARMKQLNATDEEFKLLAPIVKEGKEALKAYALTTGDVTEKMSQFRTQILEGTNELLRLKEAGQQNSAEYIRLQDHVAKLTQEYREQRQAIKFLSSETRAIDFGKAAVQSAISAFQVYTSISILAGGASEELQKKTLQLFAAMQLLASLEQLAVSIKKGSILATGLQTTAQSIYTAVVGASTGALKAFRIALAATGIGAAIVLIGFLAKKYFDAKDALEKASEATKLFRDINKDAAKSVADDTSKLEVFRLKLNDLTLSQKDRVKFAKEYNEVADKTNQLDLTQLNNLTLVNEQIDKQNKLVIQRAVSVAALAQLNKVADKFVEAQLNLDTSLKDAGKTEQEVTKTQNDVISQQNALVNKQVTSLDGYHSALDKDVKFQQARGKTITIIQTKEEKDLAVLIQQRDNAKNALDSLAKTVSPLITDVGVVKDGKEKTAKAVKEIQDDFEARKAALLEERARLAEIELQSEVTIRTDFDAKLKKALLSIDKDKGLKPNERKELVNLTVEVNTTALNKALDDLRKKRLDAQQKLDAELKSLQDKNTLDQLNLIQDEFDRRARLIEFNEQRELDASKENTTKRLQALDLERLLIGEQAYQDAKAVLISAGEQNALDIIQKFANERKTLSADIFQSLLGSYTSAIANADLVFTEDEAKAVTSLSNKFAEGKISYEKYQSELARIQKDADRDRLQSRLTVEIDELAALDRELASIEDKYSEHYKKLKKQRDELAGKVAEDTIQNAKVEDPNQRNVQTVAAYADAVGQVADSVIQFWQAANDAETKALDRSIALQERRVDAAQRIADRGNAQYLKAEEDRLTELQVKRENAAKKQLGIDAALQASQILVAITGAVSRIAGAPFGAETIADIAIIIGALATGYGIVKSLQGNQPKLFEGTPHVSRGTNPAGIDTIPAWLNEGEAVIPTSKNKKYKKSVEAIYHGKVPAEVMNDFVENYVRNKVVNETTNKKNEEIHKAVNEISEKKVSLSRVNSILNKEAVISDLVTNKINSLKENKVEKVFSESKNISSVVDKNISFNSKYSNIIDKVFSENKNLVENKDVSKLVSEVFKSEKSFNKNASLIELITRLNKTHEYKKVSTETEDKTSNEFIYRNFVENVSKVPARTLSKFIETEVKKSSQNFITNKNYEERKFFKGTPHLDGKEGIDNIPIWASRGEAIIPAEKNIVYKPVIEEIFKGKIPVEHLNSFVNNYHSIKPIPQPDYKRIKEAAEIHIAKDGKMHVAITEQNKLIADNNELQKQVIKSLRARALNVTMDKEGFAMSFMEVVAKNEIDKRI